MAQVARVTLTIEELATATGFSRNTLIRARDAGRIPYLREGRRVNYELDRVLDALRVPSQPVALRQTAVAPLAPALRLIGAGADPALDYVAGKKAQVRAANRARRRRVAG